VGKGRVSQASLADEMVDFFANVEKIGEGPIQAVGGEWETILPQLLQAILGIFPKAWAGRKYSIKTGAALRAFIRVSQM